MVLSYFTIVQFYFISGYVIYLANFYLICVIFSILHRFFHFWHPLGLLDKKKRALCRLFQQNALYVLIRKDSVGYPVTKKPILLSEDILEF